MKLIDVEQTYICQCNKHKDTLERYAANKNDTYTDLLKYYKDIQLILRNTPAYGVSGVNKMMNELKHAIEATRDNAKKGKTSAHAHANKILNLIKMIGNDEADCKYKGNYKLESPIPIEELDKMIAELEDAKEENNTLLN